MNLLGDFTKWLILVPLQNPDDSHVFSIFRRWRSRWGISSLKRVAWAVFDDFIALRNRGGCNGGPGGSRFGARSIVGSCSIRNALTRNPWTHEEGFHVPLGCAMVKGFDHIAGVFSYSVCRNVLALLAQLRRIRSIVRRQQRDSRVQRLFPGNPRSWSWLLCSLPAAWAAFYTKRRLSAGRIDM